MSMTVSMLLTVLVISATSPSPWALQAPGWGGVWYFNSTLLKDVVFNRALMTLVGGLSAELFSVDGVLDWWVGVKWRIKYLV